jgi:nicotinamide riboside transporter PnuC
MTGPNYVFGYAFVFRPYEYVFYATEWHTAMLEQLWCDLQMSCAGLLTK